MSLISYLQISVVIYNDTPEKKVLSFEFSEDIPITIGRGRHNHIVLDDPSRIISRVQAKLAPKDTLSVEVMNLSASTNLYINAREITPGGIDVLHFDEILQIGAYKLKLNKSDHSTLVAKFSVPENHLDNRKPYYFIPDDINFLFDDKSPQSTKYIENVDPVTRLTDEDSKHKRVTPNLDRKSEINSFFTAPRPAAAKSIGSVQAVDIAANPDKSENIKEIEYSQSIKEAYFSDQLLDARCRGMFARAMNINSDKLPEFTPEFFEQLGGVLLHLTAGIVNLMHERAQIKHEMRADVTIIASSGNNPLKFAPDAQSAIAHLLNEPMPGFMRSKEAINDAVEDLLAHQVGLVSGSRAAVYEVVKNFSPDKIKRYLTAKNIMSSLIPMSKKSSLWELYEAHYAEVAGSAREEFELRFQQAFAHAYEQEIDKFSEQKESL